MSALSRVAVDNHKNLSVEPGDTVVLSSRIIPGNEKAIGRMMNHLARRGADIVYGSMNPPRTCVGAWQRGGIETGAEPGSAAILHPDTWRVSADGEARVDWRSIC